MESSKDLVIRHSREARAEAREKHRIEAQRKARETVRNGFSMRLEVVGRFDASSTARHVAYYAYDKLKLGAVCTELIAEFVAAEYADIRKYDAVVHQYGIEEKRGFQGISIVMETATGKPKTPVGRDYIVCVQTEGVCCPVIRNQTCHTRTFYVTSRKPGQDALDSVVAVRPCGVVRVSEDSGSTVSIKARRRDSPRGQLLGGLWFHL